MEISGDIGIFEGPKACVPLRRHLFGAKRFLPWLFLVIYIVALFGVGALFDAFLPSATLFAIFALAAGSLYLWIRYCRGMAPKAWLARGVPPVSNVVFRFEDAGIVITGPVSETRLAWNGVSQVTRDKAYWLFIGPGLAYFLPVRFFADRNAEQAFLEACLDRLTPEARARTGHIVIA